MKRGRSGRPGRGPGRWRLGRGGSVGLTAVLTAAICLAIDVPAERVAAQTPVAPEEVSAIAESLNCPLCQGYNLEDCPLEVCAQMRAGIAESLAAGMTRDEIVAGFVADYGPQVLNQPPRSGFSLAAWVVPPFAVVLALVAAWRTLRARSGGCENAAPGAGGRIEDVGIADYAELLERLAGEGDGDGAD